MNCCSRGVHIECASHFGLHQRMNDVGPRSFYQSQRNQKPRPAVVLCVRVFRKKKCKSRLLQQPHHLSSMMLWIALHYIPLLRIRAARKMPSVHSYPSHIVIRAISFNTSVPRPPQKKRSGDNNNGKHLHFSISMHRNSAHIALVYINKMATLPCLTVHLLFISHSGLTAWFSLTTSRSLPQKWVYITCASFT